MKIQTSSLIHLSARLAFLITLLALVLGVGNSAQAVDGTWTQLAGGSGSGIWTTTANWSGGIYCTGPGSTANFNTLNLTADKTVHGIAARNIGYMIFGDTDTSSAAGWILDNNGSEANLFNLTGGTPPNSITVNALGEGKNVNISASLIGSSAWSKLGVGTLVLSGANPYTADLTIGAGTLAVGNVAALGFGAAHSASVGKTIVSASGAALDLNGTTPINEPITLNGTGISSSGALLNSSATAVTIGSGIAGLTLTAGGSGYGSAPAVTISGTGSGAAATASLGVTAASFGITSGGAYSTKPTVLSIGGGGSRAGVTLTFTGSSPNFKISGFTVTAPGSGYTSAPTITLTGGVGTAAVLTANAANFTVSGVAMTAAGSGYTGTPSYSFGTVAGATPATPGTATLSSVTLGSDSSLGGSGNLTINSVVSGAFSLTKVGANTLTLSGANTYSGSTIVSNGTLLATSLGSGAVEVRNGAALGAGSGNTVATLSLGSHLTLDSSVLLYDITNTANADKIVVAGDLRPSGVTAITLGNTTPLPNGDYTLLEINGTLGGGATNFSVASQPPKTYAIVYQANKVVLQVTGTAMAKTWTGDGGANLWDINTSTNWVETGGPLTPVVFNNNDGVAFDDRGSTNPVVTLTATVLPVFVTVNSASSYTFINSGGGLGGNAALTKLGTGQLYLQSANTYSGGTTISAPTVFGGIQIFDANALGSGVLTINNQGGLSFGANVAAGNGGLGVTNDIVLLAWTSGNALSSAGKLSGKISGPGNWSWNGFSSGSLTLSGDNWDWRGGFSFGGPITLYLGHTNALGSGPVTMYAGIMPVISAAADLSGGLGVTNAIVMSGNSLTINLANNLLLSGPISGSGNLVKSGSATLVLGGNSPFTGGTTVSEGTLAVNGRLNGPGAVMVASGATLGGTGVIAGPVTVLDGGTVNPGAGQLTLDSLTLSPDANIALTLGAADSPTNSSLRVNGNLVLDGNLIISDSAGMSTGSVYSVINYTGTLTDHGCKVDPYSSWDMTVDTSLPNSVRLIATRKLPPWKSRNVVNVQSFGATGDGLTDDTAAIQAALNYAAARLSASGLKRAGAAVVFPSGTYLVSDRLTFLTANTLPNGQGLTIRGEGMTNTILRSINETGSGLLYFDLQSPVLNGGFKLQIEDIGLQSARGTSLSGAAIEIAPHNTDTVNVWPIFRAVQISGYASDCGFNYGVKANKMNRSVMDRVAVYGQGNGSEKMTAGFYYDYCYGPVLRDCFVSGARTGMLFTNGGEGTMLNRCTITNADTGIYVDVDPWNYIPPSSFDGKVLNSVICANNKGFYMYWKGYFTVANNIFVRQGNTPGYVDITMKDSSHSFISENVFSGSESGRTGIELIKLQFGGEYNTIAANNFGAFDTDVWLSTLLNSTRILANSNLPSSAVVDYANTTFFQPIYTNWLRSPHVSPAAAPSEELHPWEVFRDGRRIVNVADYGATGDGTTDDSTAVSNALSAFVAELNLDRAAGLYFPAGTYQLSQPLKGQFATTGRNAAIFGDGMNVSTIDWRGANFLELVDTGISATAIDFHHLRITTPSTNGDNVILSVNQDASTGTNRSFRACDMAIDTYGAASSCFGIGIFGAGLKNPLFRNVFIEKYQWWTRNVMHNNGSYGSGLVLTNGTGFESENLQLFDMPSAMDIHSVGGSIVVKNSHEFSVGGDVKINAGGGTVAIQGAHIASTNNLNISNASAVSLTDTLFLSQSTTNINSEEGTLRLTACTNVIVRNNGFGFVDTNLNPQRFSIRLGPDCRNVEIAGNLFGEGIGIIIPAGAVNVRAFENRFLNPVGTDIVCQDPTAKILMLPGEENPDLAAIWNLDEGAGTNVHGQCYGLDGVISGAAWVAGKHGTGLRFNGVDNSVTVAQYPEAFRYIMTNFTIMAWVKPEKAIGGDEMSGQNYVLYPTSDVQPLGEPSENHVGVGVSVGTNRIKVVERTGSIFTTSIDFTGTISSSEWTHVAVAYSNSLPRLYLNGVLQAVGSASARIPHPGCWGGGSYGWYQGALDEYRVYRHALSANEIIALGTAIPKTWTGDGGANLWDVNTSANWVKPGDPLTPAVFNNNDAVTFDDRGSMNPVVTLTTTVLPAAVTVNSASSYTFINSSGGGLGGSGTLTKLGNGELSLRSANTYSGGTILSSSWPGITIFDANALGTGVLTMNGGNLSLGANVVAGNGGLGVTNDISMQANSTGNALMSAGKFSGKISGPGNWACNGFSYGSVTLSGDNSGWSGGFNIYGPITLYLGHTNAMGSGALTMDAGTFPVISAAADLFGGQGVTNAIVLSGNLLTINLTNNLLLSGPISGTGNLVKSGSATLILSGNNPFTGNLTISDGTLFVNSPGSLAAGSAVAVNGGGRLGGNGTINGAVTVNAGGTLAPGANAIGKLTINNSLTLAAGSATVMEINQTTGTNDVVAGLTSVSFNGTLTVTNLGSALAPGGSFKLFDAAAYSGSFANIVPAAPGAGLIWDASTLTSNGTLRVVAPCIVTILTQPVGRAAVVGSAVSFSVGARTSSGVTNYQWRLEGLPIPGATNKSLVLSSVQATNFGAYSADVDNGICSTASRTVQLTPAVSPAFLPVRLNGTTLTLSFPTEIGPTYIVEYKDALEAATWNSLNTLNGTGSTEVVTDTTANSHTRFYRIRVQ